MTSKFFSILILIGIIGIVISQTVTFTKKVNSRIPGLGYTLTMQDEVHDEDKKNMFLYGGIALTLVGGIGYIMTNKK